VQIDPGPARARSDGPPADEVRSRAGVDPRPDGRIPCDRSASRPAQDRGQRASPRLPSTDALRRGWTRFAPAIALGAALAGGVEQVSQWLGGDRLIAMVLVLVLALFVVPFMPRPTGYRPGR
jgi:hypothetical protein